MKRDYKIYAVDFDGTLCTNEYPNIGEPNEPLIDFLIHRRIEGHKLILWTCRTDELLREARRWCLKHNLIFHTINKNLPAIIEEYGIDSRKIYYDVLIDNKAMPFKDF